MPNLLLATLRSQVALYDLRMTGPLQLGVTSHDADLRAVYRSAAAGIKLAHG